MMKKLAIALSLLAVFAFAQEIKRYSKIVVDGVKVATNVDCKDGAESSLDCQTAPAGVPCSETVKCDCWRAGVFVKCEPVPTPSPGPTITPSIPPPGDSTILKVGFGAVTQGGETDLPGLLHDVYIVTNLNDSGPGTLREGIFNRNQPRVIKFSVAGTITPLTTIRINEGYLTIDGGSAPAPGITISIPQKGLGKTAEFKLASVHDIIIHGLRFQGDWNPGEKNAGNPDATFSIDGDANPNPAAWDPNKNICLNPLGQGSCRIIIDQNTFAGASDSGFDRWCDVKDVTVSRNLFIDSYHPQSNGCDTFANESNPKARKRFTDYQNVFAYNGERQSKFTEGVYDVDWVNNVVAFWQDYGTAVGAGPGGYALLIDDDGGQDRHNYIGSYFIPSGTAPPIGYTGSLQSQLCIDDDDDCSGSDRCREKRDCIFGDTCKYDAEEALLADGLHFAGNKFAPKHYMVECKSTVKGQNPFVRPYTLDVLSTSQLGLVVDAAGVQHLTPREAAIKAEVKGKIQ